MRLSRVLVLVDLQDDFLSAEGLVPHREKLVEAAGRLLDDCRSKGVPVVHVWTTIDRELDNRMPHWKESGTWKCVRGTPGHETPECLRPKKGERIVHKSFHSAFSVPEFDISLSELSVDGMLLAGVHMYACIRATALDAYARGWEVAIAREACGSDDPAHASVTKAFLEYCGINFWQGVEYEASAERAGEAVVNPEADI